MMITWKNLQDTLHDIFYVNSILKCHLLLIFLPHQHIAMHKMSHDDNRKKKMNFMLPLEYCKIGIQPKLA